MIGEGEIAQAIEHPRGTERRRLLPYREALNDARAYARLPLADRDAIVRWVETRRIVKERTGLDHNESDLADPLIPLARLRAHVIEGERIAAGLERFDDPGGNAVSAVARLRSLAPHHPTA